MKNTTNGHLTELHRSSRKYKMYNKILRDRFGVGTLGGYDEEHPASLLSFGQLIPRYYDVTVVPALIFLGVLFLGGLIGAPAVVIIMVTCAALAGAFYKNWIPSPKAQMVRKKIIVRRAWSELLCHTGLVDAKKYRDATMVPGIAMKFLKSGHGHEVTIAIPPGQTYQGTVKKLTEAAQAHFRALRVIADPETRDSRGGTIRFQVLMTDPLAAPVPVGKWAIAPNDLSAPIRFGTYLDGTPATQSLWCLHGLTAGTTGSGKSASTHMSILAALSHPSTQVHLIDLKDGIELNEYRSRATSFGTSIRDAADILASVYDEMVKRNKFLVSINARKAEPMSKNVKASMPAVMVFFDEFGTVEPAAADNPEDKEIKARIAWFVKEIARLGRSSGISLNLISQRMSTNVISGDSRMLFRNRTAFKADDAASLTMILGQGWADAGVDLSGPVPPGVGLTEASGELREFRGFYLSDAQITKLISALPARDHRIEVPRRQLDVEAKAIAAQQKSEANEKKRVRSPRKPRMTKEEP